MATIAKVLDFQDRMNNHMTRLGDYTGPLSYATGGESLPPEQLGLGALGIILFELARNAAGTVYGLRYDATNKKVIWYVLDTGAEVANATDLTGFSARFFAIGK